MTDAPPPIWPFPTYMGKPYTPPKQPVTPIHERLPAAPF